MTTKKERLDDLMYTGKVKEIVFFGYKHYLIERERKSSLHHDPCFMGFPGYALFKVEKAKISERVTNEGISQTLKDRPASIKSMTTEDFLKDVDWPLLKDQKRVLYELVEDKPLDEKAVKEAIEGIIALLDFIQDHAVDHLGIPEDKVFLRDNV